MRNWEKLYETYKIRYFKKEEKSKVGMEAMYSKMQFEFMYEALEKDRLKEVQKGERKVLNITQDLIARQENFDFSYKKAREIRKAVFEETGEKIKLFDIRSGIADLGEFWNTIKEYNKNRKYGDPTVGQVFFGSA